MRYARSGQGVTGRFSELLGIYEACLVPVIEEVIARQPHTVINVGAAYGYYELGFAWRCPDSHIIAYEVDRTRSNLMQKYCTMNRLEARVELRGECTSASLRQDLRRAPGAFLIMDVEGAEDTLLYPDTCDFEHSEIVRAGRHRPTTRALCSDVCAYTDLGRNRCDKAGRCQLACSIPLEAIERRKKKWAYSVVASLAEKGCKYRSRSYYLMRDAENPSRRPPTQR